MSAVAVTWALSVTAGGPGPKAVLIALAHHADKHGVCWPSQQTIADELEMGVSTVRMHVVSLERKGLIEHARRHRKNGSRTSNEYVLMMSQPPESSGSLPPDFSGKPAPESSGRTDSPPDLSGYPESNASPNQDNRQISANLPPESGGPTSFEQSEEGTERKEAAVASPLAHTREGEPPATPPAPGEATAAAAAVLAAALDEMRHDTNDYVRENIDAADRKKFKFEIRPIVNGDDFTLWRDTSGNAVPWSERPRLLRCAFGILTKKERPDIRRSITLAIQQQFDPFAPTKSTAPRVGSENAAVLSRGKTSLEEDQPSKEKRMGRATTAGGVDPERERQRAIDAEIEAAENWERAHPAEAERIRNQVAAKYANDPEWKAKGDLATRFQVQGEYRRRIREQMQKSA